MNITSPSELRNLLMRYDFTFSKGLGQNFLIDENILSKISGQMYDNGNVLEIGTGVGTLTQKLCQKSKKVVGVEIDKRLLPLLAETLSGYDNVEIINNDILKLNPQDIIADKFNGERFSVCANLPYYITTPIIFHLIENDYCIKRLDKLTFLVQKEVGDRIIAQPCAKNYGAISVGLQAVADIEIVSKVPMSVFMPRPKVDSSIVTLTIKKDLPSSGVLENLRELTKACFAMRRKTLLNNFKKAGFLGGESLKIISWLNSYGIDAQARGETLSVETFLALANDI